MQVTCWFHSYFLNIELLHIVATLKTGTHVLASGSVRLLPLHSNLMAPQIWICHNLKGQLQNLPLWFSEITVNSIFFLELDRNPPPPRGKLVLNLTQMLPQPIQVFKRNGFDCNFTKLPGGFFNLYSIFKILEFCTQ